MGKFKIGIKFDKNFLKGLTQESNSGVVKHNVTHHLALHPIHLNNFNKSIKDLLNEGIAKYNKSLDGILLGYDNIKLLSNMGTISNDSPYIHYDFLVDFFIFKPEIGKTMQGIVNRKSKDHVGILVYNAFNVSIPKPQEEDDWLGNSIEMGYEVLFRISFIDFSSYLPYIKGELVSIISEVEIEGNNNKLKTVKNKKIIFNDDDFEEEPVSNTIILDPEVEEQILEKMPKKKKKKHKEKDNDENAFDELNNEKSSRSKKRKAEPDIEYEIKPKKSKKNKEKEVNEILIEEKHDNEFEVKEKKKHKKKKEKK